MSDLGTLKLDTKVATSDGCCLSKKDNEFLAILCLKRSKEYFDVPETFSTVWIVAHEKPSPYRVAYEPCEPLPGYMCSGRFDRCIEPLFEKFWTWLETCRGDRKRIYLECWYEEKENDAD